MAPERRSARPRSPSPHCPFRPPTPELVWQWFALRQELQRDGVDAIALPTRRRAVGEDMALVCAAAGADTLGPDHAVAGVADMFQVLCGERRGEARPASAALELGPSGEQRQATKPTGKDAWALLTEKDPAVGRFRPVLEQHLARRIVEICGERLEL